MREVLPVAGAALLSILALWLIGWGTIAAGNAAAEPPLVQADPRPVKAEPPADPPALVEVPQRGCPEWTICPSPPKPE
jgi:hypothetical protein